MNRFSALTIPSPRSFLLHTVYVTLLLMAVQLQLARASDSILPATGSNANTTSTPGGEAGGALTNGIAVLDNTYRLAIGDKINFQIVEDQDDPKSLMVADSGDIEVPYLGRFPARGKTCQELATQIKAQLEKKYYYHATVVVSVDAMLTRGMIYLVGAIRNPGPLEMPRNDTLTVSKAILRAGGFTDFADPKNVRITRQGSGTNAVIIMDVSKVLAKGKTDLDKPVEPGDLIFVPEKTFRF